MMFKSLFLKSPFFELHNWWDFLDLFSISLKINKGTPTWWLGAGSCPRVSPRDHFQHMYMLGAVCTTLLSWPPSSSLFLTFPCELISEQREWVHCTLLEGQRECGGSSHNQDFFGDIFTFCFLILQHLALRLGLTHLLARDQLSRKLLASRVSYCWAHRTAPWKMYVT